MGNQPLETCVLVAELVVGTELIVVTSCGVVRVGN